MAQAQKKALKMYIRVIVMSKEFFRPLIIMVLAVVFLGILAMLIPAWENGFIPIKKLHILPQGNTSEDHGVQDSIVVKEAPLIVNDLQPLKPFLDKLRKPGENLRIAYFGDSIIEGDLLTAKLRSMLQTEHGGQGVGMVGITSIVAGFRQTIKHSFAKNWETISFMNQSKSNVSLGITGHVYIPRNYYVAEKTIEPLQLDSLAVMDTSKVATPQPQKKSTRFYVNTNPWVEYSAAGVSGGAASFQRIRLFYSDARDSSYVLVSWDGGAKQKRFLKPGSGVQEIDLSQGQGTKKIRLEFSATDPIHLYGVSFDQPEGAYVDNYPIRGYSGMYFQRIKNELWKGFQQHLDYDLIVLQYGENVSNPKLRDYSYYEKGMKNTIRHIQAALPDVPILLISAHDRSIKQNGSYVTSPDIPYLVTTQSRIAKDTGCGFWNLFAAMGGYGSMPSYVNRKPAYAGKDYTHFTRSGADHIATMLLAYLKGN